MRAPSSIFSSPGMLSLVFSLTASRPASHARQVKTDLLKQRLRAGDPASRIIAHVHETCKARYWWVEGCDQIPSLRFLRCICQGLPDTSAAPETASRHMATSSCRGCTPRGPIALCSTLMQPPCTYKRTNVKTNALSQCQTPYWHLTGQFMASTDTSKSSFEYRLDWDQRNNLLSHDHKRCVAGDSHPVSCLSCYGL